MPDPELTSADANEAIAVMAHGLLDSLTGVVLAAHTLRRADARVPAEWLLDVVIERSEEIVVTLRDLLGGVPLETISRAVGSR